MLNIKITKYQLIIIIVTIYAFLSSCDDNGPVGGGNDVLSPGLPDFSLSEFDWMEDNASKCEFYWKGRRSWYPRFLLRVEDISPDGKYLLVNLGHELVRYEIASRTILPLETGEFIFAEWGQSNQIIALRNLPDDWQKAVVVIDVATNTKNYVPLPDSTIDIVQFVPFLPGDTACIIAPYYGNKSSSIFRLSLVPPYYLTKFESRSLGVQFSDGSQYEILGVGSNAGGRFPQMDFTVCAVGDTSDTKRFSIPEFADYGGTLYDISRDGKWFAAYIEVDISQTRFPDFLGDGKIKGIAVIDLRQGSPTQYQLYRFFPDPMNALKNCSTADLSMKGTFSLDGRYFYHEQIRIADSTTQIVRRNIATGKTEEITNFLEAP